MSRPAQSAIRDAAYGRFYARHGASVVVTRNDYVPDAKSRLARWRGKYGSLPKDVTLKPAPIGADIARTVKEKRRSRFAGPASAWNCIVVVQRNHSTRHSELRTLQPVQLDSLKPAVPIQVIVKRPRLSMAR